MILLLQQYSVNVRCQNNKNSYVKCVKMRKIFTSIVNSKILVKIYKNNGNKNYNTIFKAKKNSIKYKDTEYRAM